jgi:flagellar basal-body rod protein FlgG
MTEAVAAIASAMRADAEALRSISQNVANAQTPAYRREVPVAYTTFDALAGSSAPEEALARASGEEAVRLGSSVDVRPGTLQNTGEPLNLAIEGEAFFVIGTAQGDRLTRRGDFRLDAQGHLVTSSGDAVLGANGPIQVDGTPVISADGVVRVNGNAVDRLRLAAVTSASALQARGDGLYALSDAEQSVDASGAAVRQGFLETSNVDSVGEMISLMDRMRHFESAQRFVQGYDSMMRDAINTLGKV